VHFAADASDADLGWKVAEHVEWRSSRDGLLGTGAAISAASLSQGTHTVTIRVDDGAGGVATASVRVTVVGDVSQLPPLPDALHLAPAAILVRSFGRGAREPLVIDNQNLEHSIAWQATVDVPWLELHPTSGTTPAEVEVRVIDRALAPGAYDATITVTRPGLAGTEALVHVSLVVAERPPCTGDCSGDGAVTINELITGVNIALGNQTLGVCPAFDANGDGEVTINEIIQGVTAALTGCAT
jgi:hypothetical protein